MINVIKSSFPDLKDMIEDCIQNPHLQGEMEVDIPDFDFTELDNFDFRSELLLSMIEHTIMSGVSPDEKELAEDIELPDHIDSGSKAKQIEFLETHRFISPTLDSPSSQMFIKKDIERRQKEEELYTQSLKLDNTGSPNHEALGFSMSMDEMNALNAELCAEIDRPSEINALNAEFCAEIGEPCEFKFNYAFSPLGTQMNGVEGGKKRAE